MAIHDLVEADITHLPDRSVIGQGHRTIHVPKEQVGKLMKDLLGGIPLSQIPSILDQLDTEYRELVWDNDKSDIPNVN